MVPGAAFPLWHSFVIVSCPRTASKEITLKGCLGHDRNDILESINLFAQGKVNANDFISEIIDLKDVQKTFEKFLDEEGRKFVKILVKP